MILYSEHYGQSEFNISVLLLLSCNSRSDRNAEMAEVEVLQD